MKSVIRIEMGAQLLWEASKTESGNWIAVNDAVGLTMQSDSLDELHSMIEEATQLLFEDLFEDGELDAFLRSKGWNKISMPSDSDGGIRFDVPYELLVKHASDPSRPVH